MYNSIDCEQYNQDFLKLENILPGPFFVFHLVKRPRPKLGWPIAGDMSLILTNMTPQMDSP